METEVFLHFERQRGLALTIFGLAAVSSNR